MKIERIKLSVPGDDEVSAVVVMPDKATEIEGGVVVAHGQLNDMEHPLLVTFSKGLARRGYACIRFNFPYREKGGNAPDKREALMAAMREARDELDVRIEAPIYLAGKSLGARVASYVAQEDKAPGLVFLGFPIHAPGGEPNRFEHLLEIDAPMLFFVGTRDPYCDVEKLKRIIEGRSSITTIQIVENGDHSFEIADSDKRSQKKIYEEMASVAADWLEEYGL